MRHLSRSSTAIVRRWAPRLHKIERGGRTHLAALAEVVPGSVDDALRTAHGEAFIDPQLRSEGDAHLQSVLARSRATFDGPVLVLDRIEGTTIHVKHAGYFDMIATCDALMSDIHLRHRAQQLAGGDPLHTGHGRAAAVGVGGVVVRSGRFTLGRRAPQLALDPGRWHLVPSGTVDARGLEATIAAELREEHGIEQVTALRVLGLGWDLARLRPELTLMTPDLGDVAAPLPSDEFTEFLEIPLDLDAIAKAWAMDLTPAAAVGLAAVERELQR